MPFLKTEGIPKPSTLLANNQRSRYRFLQGDLGMLSGFIGLQVWLRHRVEAVLVLGNDIVPRSDHIVNCRYR